LIAMRCYLLPVVPENYQNQTGRIMQRFAVLRNAVQFL